MIEVEFYEIDDIDNELLRFAVIVAKAYGKWVFCQHKERNTWEVPGGHREEKEDIFDAAKRELHEETGAEKFTLIPICVYSIKRETESYGLLFFAEIEEFGDLPDREMGQIALFTDLPEQLTYPLIHPLLIDKVNAFLHKG